MEKANADMANFTNPKNVPILSEISGGLTDILAEYYKDSEIIATWDPITQLQPNFPAANIDVKSNDFVTGLSNVGHGLQRAVILTVLRYMADHRAKQSSKTTEFVEAQSDLILAIEEPEIYQHPTKQRLFSRLLRKLTEAFNPDSGIRVQTIFVTHSPLLVSVGECESIRLVRSVQENGKRHVKVNELSLGECSKLSAIASGRKPEDAWSAAQFRAKLHVFDSKLSEGFFSGCVVLVEGIGDEAVLDAWYRVRDRNPHAEGIAICQVGGKKKLDKPIIVFEQLGIPCYWIFDNDKTSKPKEAVEAVKTNRILQNLAGVDSSKCEDWPVGRFSKFACWDTRIEQYISDRVGVEAFDVTRKKLADLHDIDQDTCLKYPVSAAGMLYHFCEAGFTFPELDEILEKIDGLMT